jgi:hypothetical protein
MGEQLAFEEVTGMPSFSAPSLAYLNPLNFVARRELPQDLEEGGGCPQIAPQN